jgi:hypothetical protein
MCGIFWNSILAAALSAAPAAGVDTAMVFQISAAKGPYFVVDPRVVEDRWHVERWVVPPTRYPGNPLLRTQFPWEGSGPHAGGSVLRDPQTGRYRMWYSVFDRDAYNSRKPFSYNVCLAQSEDGLVWSRPPIGVFDYHGSKDNNIIRLGTDKTQNIDVCLNPCPHRWPGKFLAIHNQKGGVFVSWSDDGHTFTRLTEKPAIAYHSDTHNNFVYDEVHGRWLLYCRPRAWAGYHRRRIALQSSRDLENWSHERTILIPTESEIPEYYGMTVFRRGDLFFGIVQIYDNSTGLMHGELAWSDDGEHWDFLPSHPAFLTLSPAESWDGGMVLPFESPVDVGDEMRFYYGGFRLNHHAEENPAGVGLMTAQRDRLIGVRSNSQEPGLLMTRPLAANGRRITMNAVVRGRITAELRTDGNQPIPGFTFADSIAVTASGFAQPVAWKGGRLDRAADGLVRIVFRLDDASLFAFELHPSGK